MTGDFAPHSARSRGFSMRPCLTYVSAIATAGVAAMTTPGLASPAPPAVAAILAANHTAVGQVPANGGAEFDYSYSGSGLTGTRTDIVDLGTGVCTLWRNEEKLDTKETPLKRGKGTYSIRFADVDQKLTLWVNNTFPFGRDGTVYSAPRSSGPMCCANPA